MAYDIGPRIGIEGEAAFRQAINALNTSFKTLGTEMSAVTSAFDKNDKSSKSLTAQNVVLNKQIDTQKEKLVQLNSGLAQATTKYGETDKVTQGWQQSVNKATAELNNMDRELAQNSKQMTEHLGKYDVFSDKINGKVNGALKGLAVGLSGAVLGVGALIMKSAESADKIQTNADIYGLSAERIQELTYVGTKLDVELETQLKAQSMLTKNMYLAEKGTGAQAEAFKKLGIEVKGSDGHLRNAKDVMGEAFTALGKMTNETERDALAQKIFGKSAMELNPLIKAGGTEIAKLTDEAHKSGAVMSNEAVAGLDGFADSTAALKLSLQGAVGEALTPLVPKLQEMADKLKDMNTKPLTDALKWVMDNGGLIVGIIAGIAGVLITYKVVHAAVAIVQGIATAAQWAFNTSLLGCPIVWIILGIAALIAIIVLVATHWTEVSAVFVAVWAAIVFAFSTSINAIGGFFVGLWNGIVFVFGTVGKWFSDIFSGAWNGIKTAFSAVAGFFSGIWDGMKSGFSTVVNFLIDGINSLVKLLLTPLNFVIKGINLISPIKIPELKLAIPNIPKFDVGTRYLPQDMLIQAHKGEMIVPKSENPYANSGGGTMPQNTGDMVFNFDMGGGQVKTIKLTSQQIAEAQRQRNSFKVVTA
jgi:hypothetical protein